MSDIFQTDQYVLLDNPNIPHGGGGGGGGNLDDYADSTNAIDDADKIVTRENADDTWYKKTFGKVWDYIKGKIGISAQGSTNKYLDEQGNFTDVLSLLHPVGTIIESTTCDTMAKVVAAYGGTTWKQHTGYILRGATSNVTSNDNSNSGTGFGGSDTETLTGAQSGLKKHGHGFTQPTVNGGATNTGWISADHTHAPASGFPYFIGAGAASGHTIGSATALYGGTNVMSATSGVSANHYHGQAAHTHTVTGGAVTDANASNATSAHSTVQRYKNVYIWERTA